MEKRGSIKAQIGMEYILIITIALMILIPGIYLFRNYAFESNDRIVDRRLADISNQLLSKAVKMYYYGAPSRTTFSVEMPPQIGKMYILSVAEGNESYLIFTALSSSGEKNYIYDSKIPLDAQAELCNDINPECAKGACKCFPARFFSQGMKNFIVEAKDNCVFGAGNIQKTCIIIDESSDQ
jgi:hypothetical protein